MVNSRTQLNSFFFDCSDDTPHGYKDGSGTSKSKCLSRAKIWSDYCENPAIATYIPEGKSSNWNDEDVQHDNHGG